jgi:bacillolysin
MFLLNKKAFGSILSSIMICATVVGFAQQGNSSILSQTRNSADNTPTSISFSADANLRMDDPQEVFRRYLGIGSGSSISMRLKNTVTTKDNITTQRYDEYYKGIKVALGGYTITGKEGKVSYMTGNFYSPAQDLSASPVLTEATAFAKAISFVGAEKYKWQNPVEEAFIKREYGKSDTSYLPKGRLTWVEDRRNGNDDHKLHLAYVYDIYAELPLSRQEVYVDAIDGKVLFSNQLIKHTAATGASRYSGTVPFQSSRVGTNYVLFDSTRGDGVHTVNMLNGTSYGAAANFTSATNTWPVAPADNVAVDAHWGAENVYDYFFTEHGRLSWDNLNGILKQYVHYSNNYNNAYWDGTAMTYGDGSGLAAGGFSPLTSIDVTAHEIGHGICQATCDLIYEKESGAMNEGFSDCWGATVEHWADPHETDAMPKNAWEMGEEIGTEPLRSLNAPLLQGQPNTYGSTNWVSVVACTPTGGNDYCGVHTNSGLLNYWYYLLVNGGTGTNGIGNSYIVNPLGWTKSGKILYQSELVLATNATYADMRIASINAANVLYGPCSPEAQSVTNAWYAVGVGARFVVCVPQIAFVTKNIRVSEASTTTTCPTSRTINIGLRPTGTIAGGSPVANILVAPGSTAIAGVDYTLSTTSVTFPAGDTSTKYFTLTVFDNGAVNDNKLIDFAFTVTPMGTGAIVAPFNDSMRVYIDNNDSIPYNGGTRYATLNEGIPVVSDFTSPFYGKQRRARSQFLLYASELTAAGVVPNVPISQIAFKVLTKASTAPFIGYTVSMANTNVPDLYTNFVTAGLTQVYLGNHTTNLGVDSIDFNTGTFTWNGTSNVVVQLCYGMNAATFPNNDKVEGVQQSAFIIGDYNISNTGTGTGCGLGYSNGNRVVVKPIMRFKQNVTPTTVETTTGSNHTWNVVAGQDVYFYSTADTQIIAGVKYPDNDLGCVNATVTQSGNGVVPSLFSAINRSRKEIVINPSINGAVTTYDVTFYMNNTELAGIDPATLFLLKTTAPTDATVSTANSLVLTPTLINGANYTGFRATYTGFGRYMLVDGPLCNTPVANITPAGPTSFCLGGNVLLSTPTGTGYTYQWQKDGIAIAGATNANYTASLGGDYTVIVNQSVCDSVSMPLTVILDSVYTANITGTVTSLCTGQTTTLTDATAGGVWSSSNAAIASVSTGGVVTAIATGVVTISYSVTNICGTAIATYTLTVNAPTALTPIAGSLTVCEGSNTSLSNATSPGVWSSSTTTIATIDAAGVVSALIAGTSTISYTHTNVFGCVSSATSVVTVNVTPAATTTPTGIYVVCTGSTATINAMPAIAGHTYQWQSSGTDIAGASSDIYMTPSAGTYRVKVTNIYGCTGTSANVILSLSATATVTPTIAISGAPGLNVCASGSPVSFTTSTVYGGSTPAYQWSVNGTFTGATGSSYSYVPSNGDMVTCQLTSSYACASPSVVSTSVIMTVNPMVTPAISINPNPNDTVCAGESASFTALPVSGGTAPTYSWTKNGVYAGSGITYSSPSPADGDVIICRMTSNANCATVTTVNSTPLTIHVLPHVVQSVVVSTSSTVLIPGMPMTFAAVTTNAGSTPSYQWFINTTPIPGATSITFTTNTLTNGQYVFCKVTTSLLCATPRITMSGGIEVKTATTGIDGMNTSRILSVVPNPNKGVFVITGNTSNMNLDEVQITVVNMLGQEVYRSAAKKVNGMINEEVSLPVNIASGMYIISVTSGALHEVFHVTVDK